MATIRGQEPRWWLERQRARLLQPRESWETWVKAPCSTSEDGERRGKTQVLLRQNVWDEEKADKLKDGKRSKFED